MTGPCVPYSDGSSAVTAHIYNVLRLGLLGRGIVALWVSPGSLSLNTHDRTVAAVWSVYWPLAGADWVARFGIVL